VSGGLDWFWWLMIGNNCWWGWSCELEKVMGFWVWNHDIYLQ